MFKRKQIINGLLILLAATILLVVNVGVRAQQNGEEATESAKRSAATVTYILPYPGILPGNILYPLKMLRDRVWGLMITQPVKKIEFNLLMADKRLNAAYFLAQYHKDELAETTISKGEKYFQQAVAGVSLARFTTSGEKNNLLERLEKAGLKHQEMIGSVIEIVESEGLKRRLTESLGLSEETTEAVRGLRES